MANRTRKSMKKLPVESVDARKGKEIRGGGTRGKSTSRGNPGPWLQYNLENTFITKY
ncbi:MAG TPA: hypothetical protein VKJ00_08350 [Thermoanaerobaculia bacterium]|nr:hypothetical protein [Thermoanaerobaculia bacterium]